VCVVGVLGLVACGKSTPPPVAPPPPAVSTPATAASDATALAPAAEDAGAPPVLAEVAAEPTAGDDAAAPAPSVLAEADAAGEPAPAPKAPFSGPRITVKAEVPSDEPGPTSADTYVDVFDFPAVSSDGTRVVGLLSETDYGTNLDVVMLDARTGKVISTTTVVEGTGEDTREAILGRVAALEKTLAEHTWKALVDVPPVEGTQVGDSGTFNSAYKSSDGALELKLEAGVLTAMLGGKVVHTDKGEDWKELKTPSCEPEWSEGCDCVVNPGIPSVYYAADLRVLLLHRRFDGFHACFVSGDLRVVTLPAPTE
jgi:hypothetical protein